MLCSASLRHHLSKRDTGQLRVRGEGDGAMEAGFGVMHFEDEGRGPKPRDTGSFQKLKKASDRFFPQPPDGISFANTLTSAQWNWYRTSGLQNYKMVSLCSLKPLSLWRFVIAALETNIPTSNLRWHLAEFTFNTLRAKPLLSTSSATTRS